jgi:hypothetical protein
MTTWAISLEVPPPPDRRLADQEEALLMGLKPVLESLPNRPPARAGNVQAFDLLSAEGMRQANSYLLLITADNPAHKTLERIAAEVATVLPQGSTASVLGEFVSVARALQPKTHA